MNKSELIKIFLWLLETRPSREELKYIIYKLEEDEIVDQRLASMFV